MEGREGKGRKGKDGKGREGAEEEERVEKVEGGLDLFQGPRDPSYATCDLACLRD